MRVAVALCCLGIFSAAMLAAAQTGAIRAHESRASVGRSVTVHDSIAQRSAEQQSGFTYFNFGGSFPNQIFAVAIPDSVYRNLNPRFLASEWIQVRGIPRLDARGVPRIVCNNPAQLFSVGGPPGSRGANGTPLTAACCAVCTNGKPCGDACIARNAMCRQPAGCACEGR